MASKLFKNQKGNLVPERGVNRLDGKIRDFWLYLPFLTQKIPGGVYFMETRRKYISYNENQPERKPNA
jgi:hypothetical protein